MLICQSSWEPEAISTYFHFHSFGSLLFVVVLIPFWYLKVKLEFFFRASHSFCSRKVFVCWCSFCSRKLLLDCLPTVSNIRLRTNGFEKMLRNFYAIQQLSSSNELSRDKWLSNGFLKISIVWLATSLPTVGLSSDIFLELL